MDVAIRRPRPTVDRVGSIGDMLDKELHVAAETRRPAGTDEPSPPLDAIDDRELVAAQTERALAVCSSPTPLRETFPTLAQRTYLTMPVRLLPTRMFGPFGRGSWADLMAKSPKDLLEIGRIDPPAVGELLVALRNETAAVQVRTGR